MFASKCTGCEYSRKRMCQFLSAVLAIYTGNVFFDFPLLQKCLAVLWIALIQLDDGFHSVHTKASEVFSEFTPCHRYSNTIEKAYGKRPDSTA